MAKKRGQVARGPSNAAAAADDSKEAKKLHNVRVRAKRMVGLAYRIASEIYKRDGGADEDAYEIAKAGMIASWDLTAQYADLASLQKLAALLQKLNPQDGWEYKATSVGIIPTKFKPQDVDMASVRRAVHGHKKTADNGEE